VAIFLLRGFEGCLTYKTFLLAHVTDKNLMHSGQWDHKFNG